MKYIKKIRSFFTKNKIKRICEEYYIKNYTINDDLSIDVDGDVDISRCELEKLPLTFRNVTGSFNCSENFLTSLKGSPKRCGKFYCYDNELESLKGGPKYVKEIMNCSQNNLTDLKYSPIEVFDFISNYNNLTSLIGCPKVVNDFDVSGNKLKSLESSPKQVYNYFFAGYNELKELNLNDFNISGELVVVGNKITNIKFNNNIKVVFIDNPIYNLKKIFGELDQFIVSLDHGYLLDGGKIDKEFFYDAIYDHNERNNTNIRVPSSIEGYTFI